MDVLAAAFWGGFFTVAAFMLGAGVAAAVRGIWRVAAVGATYSIVPSFFVASFIGLLPFTDETTHLRYLAHLTVLGSVGLTSQLLLVLRGYRNPASDQSLRSRLVLSGLAVLLAGWLLEPWHALWLAYAHATLLGVWLVMLALRKALRGNRVAWISVVGVSLSVVSLGSLATIAAMDGPAPLVLHGLAAFSSMAYVAIMGWTMWMRYAYAAELRHVLAQGPSFDPVTRLPSHAHAGRLVGSFLRSGPARPLGVIAVSLANLPALEQLHGRAAYNHALFVTAGRLRRCTPLGAELGRLGEDGFLVLLRSDDLELLKHVAAKVRGALTASVHVGTDVDSPAAAAVPSDWVANVGIGIRLCKEPEQAGSAVAAARAMSRAAAAVGSRIMFSEGREAPYEEVKLERLT